MERPGAAKAAGSIRRGRPPALPQRLTTGSQSWQRCAGSHSGRRRLAWHLLGEACRIGPKSRERGALLRPRWTAEHVQSPRYERSTAHPRSMLQPVPVRDFNDSRSSRTASAQHRFRRLRFRDVATATPIALQLNDSSPVALRARSPAGTRFMRPPALKMDCGLHAHSPRRPPQLDRDVRSSQLPSNSVTPDASRRAACGTLNEETTAPVAAPGVSPSRIIARRKCCARGSAGTSEERPRPCGGHGLGFISGERRLVPSQLGAVERLRAALPATPVPRLA